MNKIDITKKILSLDSDYDPKYFNKFYKAWWYNWRNSENCKFRLTDSGYEYFKNVAEIKFYEIRYPKGLVITNKIVIDLDRYIDCPYFIDKKSLMVSSEKVAVQLVLFDGNLGNFGKAKRRKIQKGT
jgi:hypothetical protein